MLLERLYDDFTTPGRRAPAAFLWVAFVMLGALALVVGTVLTAMTGQSSVLAFGVGFLFVAFGAVILIANGLRPRDSNNPTRACPKCATPPGGSITANGFTQCVQCGDPYFVF